MPAKSTTHRVRDIGDARKREEEPRHDRGSAKFWRIKDQIFYIRSAKAILRQAASPQGKPPKQAHQPSYPAGRGDP